VIVDADMACVVVQCESCGELFDVLGGRSRSIWSTGASALPASLIGQTTLMS
jgi:hypothetical protein